MTSLSTGRKIGIIARVAAQQAGRNRAVSAAVKAGRAAGSHWGRILHMLWLEVTGFVFLSLAGIFAIAFVRELIHYRAGQTTLQRVVLAICVSILFAWFGFSSFWSVRKRKK